MNGLCFDDCAQIGMVNCGLFSCVKSADQCTSGLQSLTRNTITGIVYPFKIDAKTFLYSNALGFQKVIDVVGEGLIREGVREILNNIDNSELR